VESIGELTRAQIVNCHEEIVAAPFRIVAVGNFDPAQLKDLLRKEFTARRREVSAEPVSAGAPIAAQPHTRIISRASEQAYLVAGFAGPAPGAHNYMAARLLNCVLGEGMSSRLFQALREEKGLAYATGSSYSGLKLSGQMFGYIGTKPESLKTAREGMLAEFERIKQELVPAEELLRAKNYMIGKFLIDHQRNFKRAFYLGHFDQMGLGFEMDERYAELISAVTPEQVQDAAREILHNAVVVELQSEAR
jgi:predicted Zn-dependent peptidase